MSTANCPACSQASNFQSLGAVPNTNLAIFDVISRSAILRTKTLRSSQISRAAARLARQILANGPGAVRLAKRVLWTEETSWLEKGFAGEAEAFGEAFLNEEAREGLRAFLEKRQPSWASV